MTEKEAKKKSKKILYTFKRSRKSFLLEYACGLFLLVLLLITTSKGIHVKPTISYSVLGISLFSLASIELSRLMLRYKIMEEKLTIIHGLIKQNKKHVYFHPLGFVPDINTKQSRIQRLLDYGTIFVAGAGGNSFEIKEVNKPHKVMEIIENLIEKSKHPERKRE